MKTILFAGALALMSVAGASPVAATDSSEMVETFQGVLEGSVFCEMSLQDTAVMLRANVLGFMVFEKIDPLAIKQALARARHQKSEPSLYFLMRKQRAKYCDIGMKRTLKAAKRMLVLNPVAQLSPKDQQAFDEILGTEP